MLDLFRWVLRDPCTPIDPRLTLARKLFRIKRQAPRRKSATARSHGPWSPIVIPTGAIDRPVWGVGKGGEGQGETGAETITIGNVRSARRASRPAFQEICQLDRQPVGAERRGTGRASVSMWLCSSWTVGARLRNSALSFIVPLSATIFPCAGNVARDRHQFRHLPIQPWRRLATSSVTIRKSMCPKSGRNCNSSQCSCSPSASLGVRSRPRP